MVCGGLITLRRGARLLAILCLAGLLVAPGISRGDTVVGKLLRAGTVNGGVYCFTSSASCDPATPSTTRVKVSWGMTGIFGLGGQIYRGPIHMATTGKVTEINTAGARIRLNAFNFSRTSEGKTIAGSCTGIMQLATLIRIDVRCTGQITGGSVTTGSFIILATNDTFLYENGGHPDVRSDGVRWRGTDLSRELRRRLSAIDIG